MMVQSNLIVYIFCLLGILYYLKNNENLAIIFFGIGTSIKLTSIFFFFWVVFRGNTKTFLKSVCIGLFCIISPMILSGFSRGWLDLQWYGESFVYKFLTVSQVGLSYANQALSSTIYSIFTDLHEVGQNAYTLFNLGESTAAIIYKTLFFIFLFLVLYKIIRSRKNAPATDAEIPALLVLSMILLSGIAWKAHLTSLSIVYGLWILSFNKDNPIQNKIWWFITAYVTISSLAGKEIIGQELQRATGGYGIYTWAMVMIFIYFCFSNKSHQLLEKA